jgi:membrane associated rhomboid family serine protease
MNTFLTMVYGYLLEIYYGKKMYALIYFGSGLASNLFGSFLYDKIIQSKVYDGASNSVYGLCGMNLLYIIEHYSYMG